MPTHLGTYRVEERLGVGGMGEVYRAHDDSLDRPVAIKLVRQSVIRRHPAGLGKVRQRFRREARSAAQLSHPTIVQVYHVVETDHGDALVMEMVEGQSLSELVADGPLEPERVVRIGRQIALGLAEAHGKGIIHRDLKPANVMVDRDDRVKILDFGLAKAFEGADSRLSSDAQVLTGAGFLIGSYDTMSPEQARGEAIGPSSDLFALGILLYTLLTGRRPFWGKSPMATLTQICIDPHPPIPTRVTGVADELVELVDRLLAKEPEDRPPDAHTVAAILDHLAISGLGDEDSRQAAEADEPTSPMRALVAIDLLGRERSWEELGEGPAARLLARHDAELGQLAAAHDGEEAEADEGHLLLFPRPAQAVHFALAYQRFLGTLVADAGLELHGRVAIHFGEPTLERVESDIASASGFHDLETPERVARVTGTARLVVDGVLALASPDQILITRGAFDLARDAGLEDAEAPVCWMAHGDYMVEGLIGSVGLYEVGLEGRAPLAPPLSSRATAALVVASRETILGWRPAVGQQVPGREHWMLERHLGDGGFGEVWLVRHAKTGEPRVFKFCFETERLRALQREITIFRLLKEELGERHDIARILDWRLDDAPYFIESEYTAGGSLDAWLAACGGAAKVPLATRLDLIAQVAEALAAAHSVGVLHKDVKPGNILVYSDADGSPRARLADFGIGAVTDRERLRLAGITVAAGLTHEETSYDGAGTRLYQAPEVLEGKASTVQGDVYALGVVLYQMVVGDLTKALGTGWERHVDDALLCRDITAAVDVDPRRRIDAATLAEHLRDLEVRRRRAQADRQAEEEAERLRVELDRNRRRRRGWALVALVALVFGGTMMWLTLRAGKAATRANREAATASQVSTFLEDLFSDANPWQSEPGAEPTVRELLDRGSQRLATELADQPLVRARLFNVIGGVYLGLGDVAQAAEMHDAARRALESSRPESREMAETLVRLGVIRSKLLDGERAVADLERAAALAESLGDPMLSLRVLNAFGTHHLGSGDLDQAREMTERVIREIDALGAPGAELRSLRCDAVIRLAHVFEVEGRHDESMALLLEALEMVRDGASRFDAAVVGLELAHAKINAGQLVEGGELLDATRSVLEARLGADNPYYAAALAVEGTLLEKQGDPETAIDRYRRSLEIVREADLHTGFQNLPLLGLARASEAIGDQDGAFDYYHQLWQLGRGRPAMIRHPSLRSGLQRLAELLRERGDDGEAAEIERQLAAFDRGGQGDVASNEPSSTPRP